jgi:RNase adaptor protein for sRNA GlmZ degradation
MPPKNQKMSATKSTEGDADTIDLPPVVKPLPIIKVVGISGSGKSTLVRALRADGYDARPVSQEHSNVPTLWQQFDRPTYLIYLSASLEVQQSRRQDVTWSEAAHQEEVRRLAHAREHADLRIDTGSLTPEGVHKVVRSFLTRRRVRHADRALEPVQATGSPVKSQTDKNS